MASLQELVAVGHHLPGDAADLGQGLPQVQAPPGWREVDLLPLVLEDVSPQDLPGQETEQLLGEGHEVLVGGVGLVKLQHGEFRVVEAEMRPSFRKLRLISYTRSKPPTTRRFK